MPEEKKIQILQQDISTEELFEAGLKMDANIKNQFYADRLNRAKKRIFYAFQSLREVMKMRKTKY